MATVKIKFRPSTVAGREGTIFYQIIHERRPRQLLSDHHVFPSEWDEKRRAVTVNYHTSRCNYLLCVRKCIRWELERFHKIIQRLENETIPFTSEDIIEEFIRYSREYTLFNYMRNIIMKFRLNGKNRTAETYTAALNSFSKFRQGEDLMLESISAGMMEHYQAWLRNRGNCPNTVSFYNRILRAVYNRAVEEEVIANRFPFRHVYTGIDKTVKRAISVKHIRRIRLLDLGGRPSLDYARDIFMLSFMLRGMSFVDMAYLRKSDLNNGYLTYRRRKTGQLLMIAWTRDMQAIVDKYPANETDYLLPVIVKRGLNERSAYRNAAYRINASLKRIGDMINIKVPLTLYVARHSWASAAHTIGIPISIISEGMGHESENTTKIYLASLDTSLVDKANKTILKSIQ